MFTPMFSDATRSSLLVDALRRADVVAANITLFLAHNPRATEDTVRAILSEVCRDAFTCTEDILIFRAVAISTEYRLELHWRGLSEAEAAYHVLARHAEESLQRHDIFLGNLPRPTITERAQWVLRKFHQSDEGENGFPVHPLCAPKNRAP